MKRCTVCVMPDSRPDVPFTDGVCQACRNYANRPTIDWSQREKDLLRLLTGAPKNGSGYDCIVPSSGGKDSHWQVLKLLELGARPLVVTAATCHLTPIGQRNIDNLARYATTIVYHPNKDVRRKLNRLGLEMVGDISWPEHVSIFTTPFRAAVDLGIPLIFYGENPQAEYGGPVGTEQAAEMTRRWVSEFGGFLGLRPMDLIGEVGEQAMMDYMPPSADELAEAGVNAHFLGHYFPWDSHRNAAVAAKAGMEYLSPTLANAWAWENLDNAQTGLHDHMMYRKYGFGRGCTQMSVDIRTGNQDRGRALRWVEGHDGLFPVHYAGVGWREMLDNIGMNADDLRPILKQFTNWDLFDGEANMRPLLKE